MKYFFLYILLIINTGLFSQINPFNEENTFNPEIGKCYPKCYIPSQYETVIDSVMVKEGSYTEWREVLCEDKLTIGTIGNIQRALISNGFDLGSGGADRMLGPSTRAALLKYQKDQGLPVGGLNIETLNSLGVIY